MSKETFNKLIVYVTVGNVFGDTDNESTFICDLRKTTVCLINFTLSENPKTHFIPSLKIQTMIIRRRADSREKSTCGRNVV